MHLQIQPQEAKYYALCRKCINSFWRDASDVREHLICDGFVKGYTTWNLHGEANTSNVNHGNSDNESSEEDEISELLRDLACGLDDRGDFEDNTSIQQPSDDLRKIHKLVEANSQELYPTCKNYTKLRFLIRLLHIKLLGGWTDKSFDLLLDYFCWLIQHVDYLCWLLQAIYLNSHWLLE